MNLIDRLLEARGFTIQEKTDESRSYGRKLRGYDGKETGHVNFVRIVLKEKDLNYATLKGTLRPVVKISSEEIGYGCSIGRRCTYPLTLYEAGLVYLKGVECYVVWKSKRFFNAAMKKIKKTIRRIRK